MNKWPRIFKNKLWESEFDNIVSERDKLQDMKINQLILEVHHTYKKDEKITADFEPNNNEDVTKRTYLDNKLIKTKGHITFLEKDH